MSLKDIKPKTYPTVTMPLAQMPQEEQERIKKFIQEETHHYDARRVEVIRLNPGKNPQSHMGMAEYMVFKKQFNADEHAFDEYLIALGVRQRDVGRDPDEYAYT